MSSYQESMSRVLAELRPGRKFLLTSHARPDGDSVGSLLALSAVLDQLGCSSEILIADPVPAVYLRLQGAEGIQIGTQASDADSAATPVIVLECDSTERTGVSGLDNRYLINIDHHASGRDFGAINWIDPGACAVGAMIYDLALAAGIVITPELGYLPLYRHRLRHERLYFAGHHRAERWRSWRILRCAARARPRSPTISTFPALSARSVCSGQRWSTCSEGERSPGVGQRSMTSSGYKLGPRTARAW